MMRTSQQNQWVFSLAILIVFLCLPLHADPLRDRLAALPTSVGENTTATIPISGDWVTLGVREHVGYLHLQRANPGGIGPGQTVVIPGRHLPEGLTKDGIVLNLPELMLYQWRNGRVVNWYPVSVGMITERWHTPVGVLYIKNRVIDPIWHRPAWAGGGAVPPGPNNPLGDRWIGLSQPGYGIHGTNIPSSIGRTVSHGCIRLYPPYIHALFDSVSVGMPVVITYETVTVGYQNGIVYLAIFPDIYQRGTNNLERVSTRLKQYDLAGAIPAAMLEQQVTLADGIAHPILGSNIAVMVDGEEIPTDIGPTMRDGVTYLPVPPIADALGVNVTWNPATNTVSARKGMQRVSFRVGESAFSALGTVFIPIRAFVTEFGGTVDLQEDALLISTR